MHIKRVINAGGIPQKNDVLNQVYANVLGRPVLVPSKSVTSLGSAIFAFLAAGTFKTIEEAQKKFARPTGSSSLTSPSKEFTKSSIRSTASFISPLAIRRRKSLGACCRP